MPGSPFRCDRFFDGASGRGDRLRHPLVGGAGPSSLKRTACHARTATPDRIGGHRPRVRLFAMQGSIRSSPMNSPWEPWSPYWWQTVTAVPPFGMSFESSSAYAQPSDGSSNQARSPWPPPAAPGVNSGILGQLGQLRGKSSSLPFSKPTSLLGQFLTGAGMPQATQNGSQTETEAGLGNYTTPAQSRSDSMSYCVDGYVRCQDLHGSSMLRNGKRCGDCLNMCTLNGTWPSWYCPIY
jgi:hypothetical protein